MKDEDCDMSCSEQTAQVITGTILLFHWLMMFGVKVYCDILEEEEGSKMNDDLSVIRSAFYGALFSLPMWLLIGAAFYYWRWGW